MRTSITNILDVLPALIASGAALSGALNLGGLRLVGLAVPATVTGSTLTFQVSVDGGTTWVNMFDKGGNEIAIAIGASRLVVLDPADFAGVQWLKVRSGTSGTPVNQGQDTTFQLVLRTV